MQKASSYFQNIHIFILAIAVIFSPSNSYASNFQPGIINVKFKSLNNFQEVESFINLIVTLGVLRIDATYGTSLNVYQSEQVVRRKLRNATTAADQQKYQQIYSKVLERQDRVYNTQRRSTFDGNTSSAHLLSFTLRFARTANLDAIITAIKQNPSIEFAHKSPKFSTLALPRDPFVDSNGDNQFDRDSSKNAAHLWNIEKVNASTAWDTYNTTGRGVVVAVIDDGIEKTHPELRDRLYVNTGEIPGNGIDDDSNGYIDDVTGYNFFAEDADKASGNYSASRQHIYSDATHLTFPNSQASADFHGTAVAAVLAAEGHNNWGIVGVAPEVKIMPLLVLSSLSNFSSSDFYGFSSGIPTIAKAIKYAADNGADIINLSLGIAKNNISDSAWSAYKEQFQDAIDYATQAGVLVVVASGNNGEHIDRMIPASNTHVLTVGATDKSNSTTEFSNYGNGVDITAPGEQVRTAVPASTFGYGTNYDDPGAGSNAYYVPYFDGTSFAAPAVAGAAALLIGKDYDISLNNLKSTLTATSNTDSVTSFNGRSNGGRNLNIAKALGSMAEQEVQHCTSSPLHVDTNKSGSVSAVDALIVINFLNGKPHDPRFCYDVNGDGNVTAVDALQVINYLNR